ncbi:hypothetical protein BpHYR1_011923 [Brachionus plicatilis]|uniref:Uncharacterized protein n=1 Tax=Brachionus plicatilis TaxID=10195 RepID=A0A3M7R3E1_BRAPC|nr:hypothetical protein BpHYR1_011923 [Brachionus plicatilis]
MPMILLVASKFLAIKVEKEKDTKYLKSSIESEIPSLNCIKRLRSLPKERAEQILFIEMLLHKVLSVLLSSVNRGSMAHLI